MKKSFLIASLLTASIYTTQAQFKVSQDLNGVPIGTKLSNDITGSVYLYEDFTRGHVLQSDNVYYNNMELRYDLLTDRVTFRNKDNVELAFKNPIKEFQLIEPKKLPPNFLTFKNGFPSVGDFTAQTYYMVLNNTGKVVALKKLKKTIVESTPYGAAKSQKSVAATELYFIFNNGVMTKIKKDKNSIINTLGTNKEELSKFISEKKLTFRSEEDIRTIMNFYNSLGV
jgi:hypothetical protein